jgi:hypothetical protein
MIHDRGSQRAGPVFAQCYIPPQRGYYTLSPNGPALTGGSSLGHNQLDRELN